MLGLWGLVFVAAIGILGTAFAGALTTEFRPTNNPGSKQAQTLIDDRITGQETVAETALVRSATLTVDDPEFQAAVEELEREISALGPDIISSVVSFYSTGNESFVSADRRSTIIPIAMTGTVDDADPNIEFVYEPVDALAENPAFEVFITGETTFAVDFAEQSQADLEQGEAIGAPIALGILVVVFGAVAAAFLPMVIAIGAIILSLAGATLVSNFYDLHVFTQNVATMIGLAVGIDYSLFIVSRFREERRRGREKIDAIATAGGTAGRAVLVSGTVVVIALLGMLLIPFTAFFSVGMGAILVVIAALLATLTLLPAFLSLFGDNINRLRLPFIGRFQGSGDIDAHGGVWDKVSYAVMRRPVVSLLLAGGALVALTIPLFTIETGLSGVSTFPDDLRVTQGFAALQQDFGFGADAPVNIVLDGDVAAPATHAGIEELRAALAADPDFGPVTLEVSAAGDLALIAAPAVGDPNSAESIARVELLRDVTVPAIFEGAPVEAYVGGLTAETIDFTTLSFESIPIVLTFVIVLTLVILTVVFRSVVVPIKAVILNLLSVGASYGVLVLVFQHGVMAEQLGFTQSPIIQAWIPLFLFAILFGLSMDYHVFLLSRIRERYDQTRDNSESVAFGVRSTAGLITGAALIMVAVFSGFAAGSLVPLQQMGFGLAVAVFLDATIVRVVLVPASMQLLGDRNWYLPKFLEWLPDIRVEGAEPTPPPARMDEASGAVAGS
ncbi:MAG: MMPL family transporter [Chloroflexi bacterium]|nr:MMPL family transporter [Chloroflexota bacterium]